MPSEAVIFIPGIKGTKLTSTNRVNFDTIWSGLQSNFETIQDLELTSAHDGKYYDKNIRTIIHPGEIEELAYAEFLGFSKIHKVVFTVPPFKGSIDIASAAIFLTLAFALTHIAHVLGKLP